MARFNYARHEARGDLKSWERNEHLHPLANQGESGSSLALGLRLSCWDDSDAMDCPFWLSFTSGPRPDPHFPRRCHEIIVIDRPFSSLLGCIFSFLSFLICFLPPHHRHHHLHHHHLSFPFTSLVPSLRPPLIIFSPSSLALAFAFAFHSAALPCASPSFPAIFWSTERFNYFKLSSCILSPASA